MRFFLRRVLHVLLGVATGGALILGVLCLIIRQPSFGGRRYEGADRASAAALEKHVTFLTTAVRPRSAERPDNLDRSAAYIRRFFEESGARVSEETFSARGRTYRNVIGEFGPPDGQLMVVGAHYDAFASTGDLPGADDNASGTAGLIELARLLGLHAPASRVQLVAFTTEEPPFFGSDDMGSAVHAVRLSNSQIEVTGMICLEMIGYFRGEQAWPSSLFALLYPRKGDFIAVTGGWRDRVLARKVKAGVRGAGDLSVYSFTGPREMLDASDQRNYWSHGWAAVMVTDTAYLRNPNYHTKRDTLDTLDFAKMASVVDGVFNTVRQPRTG